MIVVSGEEVVRALLRAGFARVSQKGSHRKMRHPDGRVAIVPMHAELTVGTLKSVLRQAGLTEDELRSLLKR